MKDNRGSLAVEASLSLVIFIFGFIAILSLCKITKAQIILQHGVNQVAKEISQYTYILNKIGLERNVIEKNKFIEQTDNMIDGAVNLYDNITNNIDSLNSYNGYNYDDVEKLVTSIKDVGNNSINYINEAEKYFSKPTNILKGFALIAKEEIANELISRYIASPINKVLIKKYIEVDEKSADKYLRKLGVVDGIYGLNFQLSTLFNDGKTINVTLMYSMRIKVPFIIDKLMIFKVNASTIGWKSKLYIDNNYLINSQDDDHDGNYKEYINLWDYGGERTTNEFIKILKKQRNLEMARLPVALDFYDSNNNKLTYVHSMNTEKKSYTNEAELNMKSIKYKVKSYCVHDLNCCKETDLITMSTGLKKQISNCDKKCKVIMVVQKSAYKNISDFNKIIKEIKDELKNKNIEIEFYFHDGKVEVDN